MDRNGGLGAAGIGATLLAGKFERGHSQRMADEARQQERLADAYVRLLVLVERVGQWAQMVMPLMDMDPPQPVRPLPGLDEQAEAEAVVNAFGSDQVRQGFKAWRDVIQDMIRAVHLINLGRRLVGATNAHGWISASQTANSIVFDPPSTRHERRSHARSVGSCGALRRRVDSQAPVFTCHGPQSGRERAGRRSERLRRVSAALD